MKSTRRMALTIGLAYAALPAIGAEPVPVTFSGFGTAALTKTDTNEVEYVRLNQASGAGLRARTGVDSNFGLQAVAPLTDRLSVTVQELVRKDGPTDAYRGELAWAFLKYKASDDITLRVGRTTLPVYMISDSRQIGYANVMIRPVAEVYNRVPVGSLSGADILYQHTFGSTVLSGQISAGVGKSHLVGGTVVDFDPMIALQLVAEQGPYTYRLGHTQAKFSVSAAKLTALLSALQGAGQSAIADQLGATKVRGKFTSAGFAMDQKNFLIQAEYAKKTNETRVVADMTSWYAMAGYRYNSLTPYYFHSHSKQDSIRSFSSLPVTGPLAGLTVAANGALKSPQQSVNGVGLRWDFTKSAAFKIQVDHVVPKDGTGEFAHPSPTYVSVHGPVNVYAAGIDFVF